jgi:hypothetical protein
MELYFMRYPSMQKKSQVKITIQISPILFTNHYHLPNITFKNKVRATYKNGTIETHLINQDTNKLEKVALIPLGKTVLRQVTF